MSFFDVILGVAAGISGVKYGISNSQCKSLVKELPNGIKYYTDVEGKDRLLSNNKIIYVNGWVEDLVVTDKQGNVYYDAKKAIRQDIDKKETETWNDNVTSKVRLKYSDICKCYVWVETKTNKQIARIFHINRNAYYISYFQSFSVDRIKEQYPSITEKGIAEKLKYQHDVSPTSCNPNKSVKVSKEYWEELYHDFDRMYKENHPKLSYGQYGKYVHDIRDLRSII